MDKNIYVEDMVMVFVPLQGLESGIINQLFEKSVAVHVEEFYNNGINRSGSSRSSIVEASIYDVRIAIELLSVQTSYGQDHAVVLYTQEIICKDSGSAYKLDPYEIGSLPFQNRDDIAAFMTKLTDIYRRNTVTFVGSIDEYDDFFFPTVDSASNTKQLNIFFVITISCICCLILMLGSFYLYLKKKDVIRDVMRKRKRRDLDLEMDNLGDTAALQNNRDNENNLKGQAGKNDLNNHEIPLANGTNLSAFIYNRSAHNKYHIPSQILPSRGFGSNFSAHFIDNNNLHGMEELMARRESLSSVSEAYSTSSNHTDYMTSSITDSESFIPNHAQNIG